MKKILFFMLFIAAVLGVDAQDRKVAISGAYANSYHEGEAATRAVDGNTATLWHSAYSGSGTVFPVTLTVNLKEVSHVDYMRYIPRQDGTPNGNWNEVDLSYAATTNGTNFTKIGTYKLGGSGAVFDFVIPDGGVECGRVRFTIKSGANGYASAAEVEAYEKDNTKELAFAQYFEDDLYTVLKPGVTSSAGIADADVKALVDNLLANAAGYKKFRVGEYEAYMTTSTLRNNLKISSQYNNYENPTGVYLKAGECCIVVASGIGDHSVGLKIKNWVVNENSSAYSLKNGLNVITAQTEGNVFINYYTDDFENAPNVKVHFVNAPVQGYWDQETMTNDDWKAMLKGRDSKDETIIITRSRHAQLAYPVWAYIQYCPENIDSLLTLYQQTQWALRDLLGLEKYGRQVKNRQLFYATDYGFMAAGGEGAYCNINSLGAIMTPDSKNFDFWGVGHEWGHNNQVTPGFKWSGCGETTNNIYASWAQLHFSGDKTYLRLEDEGSGVGEYSGMRGGRMQTYFEEGIRKGVAWQLQDGPDYHGAVPAEKTVDGYDADGKYIGQVKTTSRNYDHFVKLVPFWQLNLWGTMAGKCPDIIPMVIESIRKDANYGGKYNTNGKQQINWMKLACDSAGINLLPFFEKAGMLKPINAYIEDYSAGWNVISEDMISELKEYVREQGYPAFTEEINYINGHNYHIYRDGLALEVPETYGNGCAKMTNGTVRVDHSKVKNAVAYETYNSVGGLLRITMYGLDAVINAKTGERRCTYVLYPSSENELENAAYIVAVGYDGTRKMIYGEAKEVKGLEPGVYNISSKADGTSLSCGSRTCVEVDGTITWNIKRANTDVDGAADQAWEWEAADGGFYLKNLQTGLYFGGNDGDDIVALKEKSDAALLKAACVDEQQGFYSFNVVSSNCFMSASSAEVTSILFGGSTDEANLWKVEPVTSFSITVPKAGLSAVCYPFALRLPAEVKAYVVTEVAKCVYDTKEYDYGFLEEVTDIVPAYMPVILVAAQGTYTFEVLPGDDTPAVDTNLLRGVTIIERLTKNTFLSALAATTVGGATMTLKASTSASYVNANKAYMLKSYAGNVSTLYLADKGTVTSIDGVDVDETDVELFDLNGVKVAAPEKNGIYVTSGGKKIIVK